eukprot:EG_transcript_18016
MYASSDGDDYYEWLLSQRESKRGFNGQWIRATVVIGLCLCCATAASSPPASLSQWLAGPAPLPRPAVGASQRRAALRLRSSADPSGADDIPSSPAALVRKVAAAKSQPPPDLPYQLLSDPPSPAPQTVFVLGVYDAASDSEVIASMRTRTNTDDLSPLFGKERGFLVQDRIQDGVLVFETSPDAVAYSKVMEGAGYEQVASAEIAVEELFATLRRARAGYEQVASAEIAVEELFATLRRARAGYEQVASAEIAVEELFATLRRARAVAVYFRRGRQPPPPPELQAMLGSPMQSRWGG